MAVNGKKLIPGAALLLCAALPAMHAFCPKIS